MTVPEHIRTEFSQVTAYFQFPDAQNEMCFQLDTRYVTKAPPEGPTR